MILRQIARVAMEWLNNGKNKPIRSKRMPCNTESRSVDIFNLVKFGSKMKLKQEKVRGAFKALETVVNELKDSREKSLARTAVEEAYMWASRAIRSEQLERNARRR